MIKYCCSSILFALVVYHGATVLRNGPSADKAVRGSPSDSTDSRELLNSNSCRIFLTSERYRGEFGLDGANEKCSKLASDAGLDGKFKALIWSDQENDPDYDANDELDYCSGGYYLVDTSGGFDASKKVAENRKTLLDPRIELYNAIDTFETGQARGPGETKLVWTGARATKSKFRAADQDCYQDWDSTRNDKTGAAGRSDRTNSDWLVYRDYACTKKRRLYCAEQYQ